MNKEGTKVYLVAVDGRQSSSKGMSMAELASLMQSLGCYKAVNLDGGGSAQILVNNQRSLMISDRNTDFTESERPIPMGLIVR